MTKTTERTVIKADAGWCIAHYSDELYPHFYLEPIIAFVIERTEQPYASIVYEKGTVGRDEMCVSVTVEPITLDGDIQHETFEFGLICIRDPDGKFTTLEDRVHMTEQQALERFAEAAKKAAAKTG
jgi:hypothetical protein